MPLTEYSCESGHKVEYLEPQEMPRFTCQTCYGYLTKRVSIPNPAIVQGGTHAQSEL
jgi:hypothetical protein